MTMMFNAEDGTPIPTDGGQFTANVTLTAAFGQADAPDDTIPPNMLDTVTGTIDNFLNDAGEMIDEDWSVALTGVNHTHDDASGAADGSFSGTTVGDMGADAGAFSGNFHGDNTENEHPAAATGIFDANFSNGTVAGGFGARLDD